MTDTAKIYNSDESTLSDRSHAKRSGTGGKYKIQIQLSEGAKDRLFELVERTESETAAQVVRDALRLYDILTDEIGNGGELLLKSKETGETVRLKLF